MTDRKQVDAVVIGGGILGCFVARNLRRWQISTLLLEQQEDVCTGITRANSAIVYAGYDNKPGTLKAALTVRGNANMAALCKQLDVPFSRCGSLLVTYEEASVGRLQRKLESGIQNGVPDLRLLTGPEAQAMEPMLAPGVAAALYAPSTGTVNPWQLGIAAYENALHNGAEALLQTKVLAICKEADGYRIETEKTVIFSKLVFNCAGLSADRVQEMAFPPSVRLQPDGAEYLVLDPQVQKPEKVIFLQSSRCGKGITAIPCTEGNLLISGVRKPMELPFATTAEGLLQLQQDTKALLPAVDTTQVIRSFGAVRPNPYLESGESIHDFSIEHPAPGFYSLIGIKTPGLTCANELGLLLAQQGAEALQAAENPAFDPIRRGITVEDDVIICQCGKISRAAILEAIARGGTTVDGVKRRIGSGMGRCQGSRCRRKIQQLLEDANHGAI